MTEQATPSSGSRGQWNEDGNGNAQFINLTESVEMDKSSRTKVRVQVMREYHRKRAQKKLDSVSHPIANTRPLLSAKSQTGKFRLGKEKILRPWVSAREEGAKPREPKDGHPKPRRSFHSARLAVARKRRKEYHKGVSEALTRPDHGYESENPPQNLEISYSNIAYFRLMSRSPSQGSLDPFSTTSLLIDSRTQLLIHHYFSDRLYSSWLMMPMRKEMFSLAIQDPALFHTFMSHYIARYNVHFQHGDPDESLYHRTQAILLVNSRLADPNMALTDATIAAVANMAVYESSNGTTSSLLVHLNGLVKMVNMRGGIQEGGFSPNVQRLLVWTDLHCALALSEKPRFPPVNMPYTPEPLYLDTESILTSISRSTFVQNIFFDEMINRGTLDWVLADIRQISRTVQAIKQSPIEVEENMWYSDKIFYLQRSLYEVIHRPESKRGELDAAGAITAMIYCCHCLRDIPLSFRVAANGVYRLKEALEGFQKTRLMSQESRLCKRLFWVIGLGGVAAEGKPERSWFVEEFRKIRDIVGATDWLTGKTILEGVLWHPELDAGGMRLWNEAMTQPAQIYEIWL